MLDYRKLLKISKLAAAADDGEGVRVAVLDTGIPEDDGIPVSLAENFTGDDGKDSGHATFIGSMLFGASGVRGVCQKATACFGKVFSGQTARPETVAEAVSYAARIWEADIVNLSLGFMDEDGCGLLERACADAVSRGAVVVAAAGNDGGATLCPASLPEVLSVGSSDGSGRESFSNVGKVDVVAPGSGLCGVDADGMLSSRSGTSYSAALISGLLALLLARRRKTVPEAKARDVLQELKDMCVDIGRLGVDDETGHGFPFPRLIPRTFANSVKLSLCSVFAIIKDTMKKAVAALTPRRMKDYE